MNAVCLSCFILIPLSTNNIITVFLSVNPLQRKGNYSATSNNMKLVHWPLMGVGCYIWYSEKGTGRCRSPPNFLLAVPNVHPPINGQCIVNVKYSK